jgi:hypothetical protein
MRRFASLPAMRSQSTPICGNGFGLSGRSLGSERAQYRPPRAGELGGVLDVLAVALGSGGVGAALARSLAAWLQARRSYVSIRVSSGAGSVTIDARRIKDSDVASLLNKVLGEPDEP